MPVAIAPRGRILETYNISVKRRGQVESERTVSDVLKGQELTRDKHVVLNVQHPPPRLDTQADFFLTRD